MGNGNAGQAIGPGVAPEGNTDAPVEDSPNASEDADAFIPDRVSNGDNNGAMPAAEVVSAAGPARREEPVVRIKLRKAKRRPPPPVIGEDDEVLREMRLMVERAFVPFPKVHR